MTVDDVLKFEEWIDAGDTEDERNARAEAVRQRIFPDDLGAAEIEHRQQIIEQAKIEGQRRAAQKHDESMTALLPPPGAPPLGSHPGRIAPLPLNYPQFKKQQEPESWDWESCRDQFRRGQDRDGTRARLDQMKTQSRGSPFFDGGKK